MVDNLRRLVAGWGPMHPKRRRNGAHLRLDDQDECYIVALQVDTGLKSTTELIRFALRELAKQRGVIVAPAVVGAAG